MYWVRTSKSSGVMQAVLVVGILLLWPAAASAQIEVGDNVTMRLSGDLGFGYNGGFGNSQIQSMHSYGLTGDANLNGYYFHPNFLNFDVRPYYNRSAVSSDSQFSTRSTGASASVGLFGGSHFPGSISFGKDLSSNSEFRIAGVPSLTGNSSGQDFSIAWSAFVPKYPTLTAGYSRGSNTSSVSGLEPSNSSSQNLYLSSGYRFAGFSMQGNVSHNSNSFTSPQFTSLVSVTSGASSNTYGVSAQHSLPFHGGMSIGLTHSNATSDSGTNWNTSSYTAGGTMSPWRRVSVYQNFTYTTNLSTAYAQSILGGPTSTFQPVDRESSGISYTSGSTFQVARGLTVGGHYAHRIQWFANDRYSDSQFGGNLNYNYNHRLFGLLYFGVGVVDTASKNGNDGAGLNANVGMGKKFGHWDTAADFNYSQNLQTLVTVATTSTYSYGGSIRRRLNQDTSFGGSYRSTHSGIVAQAGSGNSGQSAGGSLSWKKYGFSGSYSQSQGTAVLNNQGGLTPIPGGSFFSEDLMLFNARSWSGGISTRLFRRISLTGNYSQFSSSVTQRTAASNNLGSRYGIRADYRLRRFSLLGGFNHSSQEVSFVPGGPRVVNSYYLSLSRWFNVF